MLRVWQQWLAEDASRVPGSTSGVLGHEAQEETAKRADEYRRVSVKSRGI